MEVTFAAVHSFPITKSVTSDRNSCSLSFVRRNKFVQFSFSSTCFRTNKSLLFKVSALSKIESVNSFQIHIIPIVNLHVWNSSGCVVNSVFLSIYLLSQVLSAERDHVQVVEGRYTIFCTQILLVLSYFVFPENW
jgi:hypothetical protein